MKKYKIASVLMIIHGALIEIGGCFCLIPVFILGADRFDINEYFSFIVPYFQNSMNLMLIMGMLYGIVRVIGAIGLLTLILYRQVSVKIKEEEEKECIEVEER